VARVKRILFWVAVSAGALVLGLEGLRAVGLAVLPYLFSYVVLMLAAALIVLPLVGVRRLWDELVYRHHYGVASGRRWYGLRERSAPRQHA
jgi:hypothetical protein